MSKYFDVPVNAETHRRFRQLQRLIALREGEDQNSSDTMRELLDTWEAENMPIPMPEDFEETFE